MDKGQRTFTLWRSHWAPDTPPVWDSLSEKSKAAWAAVEADQEDRERRLREALEPFASVASMFDKDDPERVISLGRWYPSRVLPEPGDFSADVRYTVSDFRRARAIFNKHKDTA